MRILVTGATGTVGRHVVDQLAGTGVDVRALTRRPETAGLPAGVQVVGGDLERVDDLGPVFDDVDRLYLLAAGGSPEQVVDLAKRAGVRRVVVLSSATAGIEGDPGGATHRQMELAVEASGLDWTHVRPGMFAANLLDWAEPIRAEGVVRQPYAGARQAPVHEADIAAVAAAALLSDEHVGAIYPLTGPESLTKPEQAAAIGAALAGTCDSKRPPPTSGAARSAPIYPSTPSSGCCPCGPRRRCHRRRFSLPSRPSPDALHVPSRCGHKTMRRPSADARARAPCRPFTGAAAAPQVMASLRNLAVSLHRFAGATNIAAALRHHSPHPTPPPAQDQLTLPAPWPRG